MAVATSDGQILAEESTPLDVDRRAESALDLARELLSVVLDRAGVSLADIRAAAAGIPGPAQQPDQPRRVADDPRQLGRPRPDARNCVAGPG